tara:strand:- start:2289 stop:2483 length:195 start_codon:yes stop_codon:yes gene_type:complete
VRLVTRKKILIVEETRDKKKQEVKPKISGEKNVATKMFRVFSNWGLVLSTPFTKASTKGVPLVF